MFLKALAAFLLLPGMVAIAVPPLISLADPWRGAGMPSGLFVLAAGLMILLSCVRDFYVSGKGTLAPWSPPESLVTIGLYRYSRNPMYVGVLTMLAGWAIWQASPLLVLYACVFMLIFQLRIVRYEEPWLAQKHGEAWASYSRNVQRWFSLRGFGR